MDGAPGSGQAPGHPAIRAIRNCASPLFEGSIWLVFSLTYFVSWGCGESGGGVGVNGPSAAALPRFAGGRGDGSPSLYCSSFIVRLRAGIICKDGNPRSQKRDPSTGSGQALGHPAGSLGKGGTLVLC